MSVKKKKKKQRFIKQEKQEQPKERSLRCYPEILQSWDNEMATLAL